MGLCKCPKRKVTNQFCYEHRVNVCEHCMVTNHPKCIVLSYLKWLQDGDYNPICELCTKKLSDEDCIRLICYHVFHWHCLDNFERQLPSTTAPAGYTCPSCKGPVFPPPNLVSPVADILREKLKTVNWARVGLGLPLLPASLEDKPAERYERTSVQNNVSSHNSYSDNKTNDTILHIGEVNNKSYTENDMFVKQFPDNVPRRLTHSTETKRLLNNTSDHDENKYERRTMAERFNRWHVCARNSRYFQFYFRHKYRRYFVMGTFLFVAFFLFMLILENFSNQTSYEEDPMLNPLYNPHINVEQS